MSLNPAKISGTCGRLMCCLRYEQDAYEDLMKHVPKNGAFVQTPDGYGSVVLVSLLRQKVKVKLDSTGEPVFRTYEVDEIAEIPGGRPKPGEEPPSVLVLKPKQKEPEEKECAWAMPALFGEPETPADVPVRAQVPPSSSEESKPAFKPAHRHRNKSKPQGQPAKAQNLTQGQNKPKTPLKRLGAMKNNAVQAVKNPDKLKSKPAVPPKQAAAGETPVKKKNQRRRYGKPRPKQEP